MKGSEEALTSSEETFRGFERTFASFEGGLMRLLRVRWWEMLPRRKPAYRKLQDLFYQIEAKMRENLMNRLHKEGRI